jgi:hypothetical protein
MAVNGTDIMLYIGGQPVFAGTTNEESITNSLRETTSKMSGGSAEYAYGKFSFMGSAEGLMAESCRNILQFTEDISNAVWIATGCTRTANFGTAPNGKKVSAQITNFSNGDEVAQVVDGTIYNTEAETVTFSVYLKGTAGETVTLRLDDTIESEDVQVNLTTSFVRYSVSYISSGIDGDIAASIVNTTDTAATFEFAQPQLEIGVLTQYQQPGVLFSQLFNAINTKTPVEIKTGSLISGSETYSGTALISDLKRTEGTEDNVTFTLSYQGSGELTETSIT